MHPTCIREPETYFHNDHQTVIKQRVQVDKKQTNKHDHKVCCNMTALSEEISENSLNCPFGGQRVNQEWMVQKDN